MRRLALLRLMALLVLAHLAARLPAPWGGGLSIMVGGSAVAAVVAGGRALRCGRTRRSVTWAALVCALLAAALWQARSRPPLAIARGALAPLTDGPRLWLVRGSSAPEVRFERPGSRVRLEAAWPTAGWAPPPMPPVSVELTGARIPPGQRRLVRGTLELHPGRRNPDADDAAARFWRVARSVGRLRLAGAWAATPLPPGPDGVGACLVRARGALVAAGAAARAAAAAPIEAHMSPRAAALAEAMALGQRHRLEPEVVDTFRDLGWSHLLAVSGLHVGFVTALGLALAHLARVRRTSLPLALGLVAYAALTGLRPSVVRATLMVLVALAARHACRPLSTERALALAALPALALCPEWLLEPGAALSFAAVLGIATLGPRISWTQPLATLGTSRGGRWLILPIWVGTAAQLGCLPILATTFHQVSPWGVPSAPLAIPVAALTVAATLLGLVLHVLVPALGALILEGAGVAAELLIVAARWGAAHLPPPWPVPSPAAAHWVLLVAGAGLLRAARDAPPAGRQHHVRALGGLLCLVVASGCLLAGAPALDQEPLARARLELLDVGQGDAAVLLLEGRRGWLARTGLRPPGRAAVLIDAGDARLGFDAGRRVVVPRLCALGLRRLTGVIASHAHRDHAGGLPAVLAALPVATLWVPPGFEALPPLAAALTRHPATTVRRATRGERIPLHPEIDVRVLHPPAGYRGTTNDRSLVVALTLPGCALLLTGDVEARGERAMLARAGLVEHCDVLKVAHHGSATSSTGAWLAAVGARHALVSVGAGNRHGHPDPAVVARLSAAGARLWRTDRDGAVVISIEHGGYRVESVIDQAAEPRRAR